MSDNNIPPQPGGWMIPDSNDADADGNAVAHILAWRPDINIIGTHDYLRFYRDVVRCPTGLAFTVRLNRLVRANIGAIYDLVPTYQPRLQWIHDGFAGVLEPELPFAEWVFLSEGIEGLITAAQNSADVMCVCCVCCAPCIGSRGAAWPRAAPRPSKRTCSAFASGLEFLAPPPRAATLPTHCALSTPLSLSSQQTQHPTNPTGSTTRSPQQLAPPPSRWSSCCWPARALTRLASPRARRWSC